MDFETAGERWTWRSRWSVGAAMTAILVATLIVAAGGIAGAAQGDTVRVSVSSDGTPSNEDVLGPAISANGRYVAFDTFASNLVPGDTNFTDVFVHDLNTGETSRVSVHSSGAESDGDSEGAAISADGRYVAFQSDATDLVDAPNNQAIDIYVRDRVAGETTRVSVSSNGTPAEDFGFSFDPAISADGRYVAFQSGASNLVAGDTNNLRDIFVHDRDTGETTRVSVATGGAEGNDESSAAEISANGQYVAFTSAASNLVPGDTNNSSDVFVHDRDTGVTTRVSVDSTGTQGNGGSFGPAISADGTLIAFDSGAPNLVAGDTNNTFDVFVHDLDSGETNRVSVDSSGTQGAGASFLAAVSADGRYAAFQSGAENLVAGDTNNFSDVFVHDLVSGETSRVSVDSSGVQGDDLSTGPVVSGDGTFVAFLSSASNMVSGDTSGFRDVFVHQFLTEPTPPTTTTTTVPTTTTTVPTTTTTPTTPEPPEDWFVDDNGHTFENDINALAAAGITRGCNPPDNDMFCPDRTLTRAESATFLDRVFGLPGTNTDHFTDDDGNTHENGINRIAEAGMTRGCNPPDNDQYCPERTLTRAEMATFLDRVLDLPATSTDHFTDDDGNTHENGINRIAEAGITRGCNPPANDRFCPDETVTRGQMAALIRRAFLGG